MLTQTYRREIPGTGAAVERTLLRDRRFCVAVVRASGLAIDMGVIRRAVRHLERLRRPQLTIVLRGRTYFDMNGQVTSLRAGDVIATDPARHDGEGYGGAPSEVLTIESEPDGALGRVRPGDTARLSASEQVALSELVQTVGSLPPEIWIARLADRLRALGLPVVRRFSAELTPTPSRLADVFQALGPALSRLDRQPSITDVAASIGTSERHVNRVLGELAQDYDHPFASWRELVHEMRLTWAAQILSVPGLPLHRVAALAGYRSAIAMHHAFSLRGAQTPRAVARGLAERWG